jgi:hypothetical protein
MASQQGPPNALNEFEQQYFSYLTQKVTGREPLTDPELNTYNSFLQRSIPAMPQQAPQMQTNPQSQSQGVQRLSIASNSSRWILAPACNTLRGHFTRMPRSVYVLFLMMAYANLSMLTCV